MLALASKVNSIEIAFDSILLLKVLLKVIINFTLLH